MTFNVPQDGFSKLAIRHLFADQIQIKSRNPALTEQSVGILFAKAKAGAERIRKY